MVVRKEEKEREEGEESKRKYGKEEKAIERSEGMPQDGKIGGRFYRFSDWACWLRGKCGRS